MSLAYRQIALAVLICIVSISFAGVAHADNSTHTLNGPATLKTGMLASLNPHDSASLVAADVNNCKQLAGIITDVSQAPALQVAFDGTAQLYVSSINGALHKGDAIGCSLLKGVGAKTVSGIAVGNALSDLDTKKATQQIITNKDGTKQTVLIGSVTVLVRIRSLGESNGASVAPRSGLQQLADSITGKQVADWRIAVAIAIVLSVVSLAGIILFTGIRYALTAVGRNPLAAIQTKRSLRHVIISGIATLFIGLIVAYITLFV